MTRLFWASLLGSVLASLVAACQPGDQPGAEYIEDMARSPAYKAFEPNQATRNGITLQHPVAGTIARGYHPFHYGKGDAEGERAGRELTNPFHQDDPVALEKGKVLFETYCLVCHGPEGKGDGPIASKIPPPTSYKSERVMGFLPGRIFHVITLGSNKMPSYASQLSPEDRWLIITYIREKLQQLVEPPPGTPDTPPAAPAAPADTAPAPAGAPPAAPSAAPQAAPSGQPTETPPPAATGSGGKP